MLRVEDIEVLKVFREATQWDKDGEVVLRSGRETARVYFTAGKIAWAIVSSNKRTFTSYLVDHSPLEEDEVQEVFRECQNTKKNLAETVIEWELLDADTVRRLLLEHLSECLLEIFSWKKIEAMFMPEGRTYQHVLTYEFQEVLDMLIKFDTDGRLPFGRLPAETVMAELERVSPKDRVLGRDLTFVPRQGKGRGRGLALILGLALALAAAVAVGWTFRAELFAGKPGQRPKGPTAVARPQDGGPAEGRDAGAAPAADKDVLAHPGDAAMPAPARADGGAAAIADAGQAPADAEDAGSTAGAGSLVVTSRPAGAVVYLDGVHTGQSTPHTFHGLSVSKPHLVLVAPRGRIPAFAKLRLDPQKPGQVDLVAKRRGRPWTGFSTIELDSDPPGALILYNHKKTPKRTPAILTLPLKRPSRLGLLLPGYENWEAVVRPVPDEEILIAVPLEKREGAK